MQKKQLDLANDYLILRYAAGRINTGLPPETNSVVGDTMGNFF